MSIDTQWVEDVRRWYFGGSLPAGDSTSAFSEAASAYETALGYEAAHPALQSQGKDRSDWLSVEGQSADNALVVLGAKTTSADRGSATHGKNQPSAFSSRLSPGQSIV